MGSVRLAAWKSVEEPSASKAPRARSGSRKGTRTIICNVGAVGNHRGSSYRYGAVRMLYRRDEIDRRIVDLQRMLTTTDDQLTIVLVKMAIENFQAERDALPASTEERRDQSLAVGDQFSQDGRINSFPVRGAD